MRRSVPSALANTRAGPLGAAEFVMQDNTVHAQERHRRTSSKRPSASSSKWPNLLESFGRVNLAGSPSAAEDRAADGGDVVAHHLEIGGRRPASVRQRVRIERAADRQPGLAPRSARSGRGLVTFSTNSAAAWSCRAPAGSAAATSAAEASASVETPSGARKVMPYSCAK